MTGHLMEMDAVVAVADLVGRSAGRSFEIGHINDDVPALWYCTAVYKGAKVIAENHDTPWEAADALAAKILRGGKCTHCGMTVSLSHSARVERCVWIRVDARWEALCLA